MAKAGLPYVWMLLNTWKVGVECFDLFGACTAFRFCTFAAVQLRGRLVPSLQLRLKLSSGVPVPHPRKDGQSDRVNSCT